MPLFTPHIHRLPGFAAALQVPTVPLDIDTGHPQAQGLVGFWPLAGGDTRNLVAGQAPLAATGTVASASVSWGSAASFAGASYLSGSGGAPLPTGNADRTYLYWVKTSATGGQFAFLHGADTSGATDDEFYLYISTGAVTLGTSSNNLFSGGSGYADGKPHMIAASYTGTTKAYAVYADGVLLGSGTYANTINTTSAFVAFGGAPLRGFRFTGQMGLVRVYNRVLPASEIAWLYGGDPLAGVRPADGIAVRRAKQGSTLGTPGHRPFLSAVH